MSKKNRHASHEEHIDETWLIPYADILTLLLALFIVLFAISSIDKEKYSAIASAFAGELNPGASHGDGDGGFGVPFPHDWRGGLGPSPTIPPGNENDGVLDSIMGDIYASLSIYIEENKLQDTVEVLYNGENVLITLKNDIWFALGSAVLTDAMKDKGRVIAQILKDNQDPEHPFEIIIAGHTDNIPINTARYPSNLDLSLDRAAEFHRFLLKESGMDPAYFSSRGYGEEKPLVPNDTSENRARNRRVEVLLSQMIRDAERMAQSLQEG